MSPFSRQALRSGIPYGLFMGIFFFVRDRDPIAALIGAGVSGVLFGLIMASFWRRLTDPTKQTKLRASALPEFSPDEHLLKEGPANHFMGLEGVGGLLFLTDRRLVFKSHRLNIQRHELSLRLDQIERASPALTAWLFRNGLQVRTKAGSLERFVVADREAWAASIMEAVADHA